MYHTWIRKEDLIRDWLSRLHCVYSCYRLLCSSVKEQPDISWSSSWVSDSCRTTWRCTRQSKTTVTPGRPARQTPRQRVRLATPISGFKPTPFGKFWFLKTRCMKFHCWNMYLDLSVSVWNQTRLKWRYEIMEWIEYENKNCEFNRMLLNFYHKLFYVYVDVIGTVLHRKVMMLQPQVQRKPREITNLKKLSGERWMNCGMVSHISKHWLAHVHFVHWLIIAAFKNLDRLVISSRFEYPIYNHDKESSTVCTVNALPCYLYIIRIFWYEYYTHACSVLSFCVTIDGHCPVMVPALNAYLTDKLPAFVTVHDASLDVIALLRILHAFNRYWSTMYEVRSTPMIYKLL